MPTFQIRPALDSDIASVVKIAAQHSLSGKTPERIASEGFLISGYSAENYALWRRNLAVADDGYSLLGFTLAFLRADMPENLTDVELLLPRLRTDFLLIKQIGVHRDAQGCGVGKALYAKIIEACPGLPIAAAILLEPRNSRSIVFHERLGFRPFFEFCGVDGARRGFWIREPDARPSIRAGHSF